MKRRNGDCGKLRRQLKRNKITEGIYGSTLLYLKFLFLWALVLLADFVLEFRFEFLWPFWLLIRSVYDSFKYQGLAFSVFFICIALTSDMICFFFIPVHWLFFAASTYVWVQYVWHTGIQERGVCLPTIILWLLFVYIEAAVRLRDLRHLPFHLDLCRPFAAHCIGYPVVTLGFGFKSYVGYRMRKRKQKDVSKENEFYLQLLLQALPLEQQVKQNTSKSKSSLQFKSSPEKSKNTITRSSSDVNISNGALQNGTSLPQNNVTNKNNHRKALDKGEKDKVEKYDKGDKCEKIDKTEKDKTESNDTKMIQLVSQNHEKNSKYSNMNGNAHSTNHDQDHENGLNGECDDNEIEKDKKYITIAKSNASTGKLSHHNKEKENILNPQKERKNKSNKEPQTTQPELTKDHKEDCYQRLENEIKKLKSDIQANKQIENDLRTQLNSLQTSEKNLKYDLTISQQDNEVLQNKIQNLNTARQTDKQALAQLERRLQEERHLRTVAESQLSAERKANKAETAALVSANKSECTENCRTRRREFENELKHLRREIKSKDERFFNLEREKQSLLKYKENHTETEILMQTLSAMQDKNAHLENSLSAETRIKLDLFSALGEAKRQLEIRENIIRAHEKEIYELKSKIAQVLAVMPTDSFSTSPNTSSGTSKLRLAESPGASGQGSVTVSTLDPNATAYTPKSTLVTSTEA